MGMAGEELDLGLAAAARRAHVSSQTICRAAKEGRLGFAIDASGNRKFAPADVDAYASTLRSGCRRPQPGLVESTSSASLISTENPPPSPPPDTSLLGRQLLEAESRALVRQDLRRLRLEELQAGLVCGGGLIERFRFEAAAAVVATATDQELADDAWLDIARHRTAVIAQMRWSRRQQRLEYARSTVATQLLGAHWHPENVARAFHAVAPVLEQLDDLVLEGSFWPVYLAQVAAHRWAGLPVPAIPWTIGIAGLRPIGPGD